MTTALQQLQQLWDAGQLAKALSMAAKWPRLGDKAHADAIRTGQAATLSPGLYRDMGRDPDELRRRGLWMLADLHNLDKGKIQ